MTEPAGPGTPLPRAFLRVGGITLARHQLGLALAMDCQRVICLAREVSPELIALQHEAEKAGARFHIISGPRALAGLLTANDDLLGLSDGLLVDPNEARPLLEAGHVVLVQPVETGVVAGYERIDLNHAAAGAFRIPGRLAEQLRDLPPDCDALSALTRIALQSGVAMREVRAGVRDGPRWWLIRDEVEAHFAESEWMRLHMGDRGPPTPTRLLSRLVLRTLGPSLLHAGSGGMVVVAAAMAVMLIGLGAGWFGLATAGFVLLALAAVIVEAAAALRRVERAALSIAPPPFSVDVVFGWLIDVALVALAVWSAPQIPWESLWQRGFAPLMLVMLVRLLPRILDHGAAPWIADRAVLAGLLAVAAAIDFLPGAVQLLAISLALAGLLVPGKKRS